MSRELAACWRARHGAIQALLERTDTLGSQLARSSSAEVLCHADLHIWNVLVDAERRLWIVDWDEAVLAAKERDLMFVVGGLGHGLVRPADTRQAGVDGFRSLFSPGNIVDLALLPPQW